MSAKVQEEDKKRKRQGHDELELEETTEVCVTRPRAPKRPRKNADIVQRQVNSKSSNIRSVVITVICTKHIPSST